MLRIWFEAEESGKLCGGRDFFTLDKNEGEDEDGKGADRGRLELKTREGKAPRRAEGGWRALGRCWSEQQKPVIPAR